MADFNSSDYEEYLDDDFKPRKLDKTAGRKLAERIHANRDADRLQSKRAIRTLENVRGAPGTAYMIAAQANSLDQYLIDNKHDPAKCPSGETIQRYVLALIYNTKSNIQGKGPSVSTIRTMWKYAIDNLLFRHRDLDDHYTKYDINRINIHIDQAAAAGILHKGKWHKKQWLGFMMIQKLVKVYIEHCLDNGCLSWDITLNKIISVVLQCACDSRAGDIMRSHKYTGSEYLQWGHIEMSLCEDGTSVQDFKAKITIKYEKGHKDVHNEDKIVFLEPLVDASHSAVCAIKLLITHALRHGKVHATNITDLIAHTAQRPHRLVKWTQPKHPVIFAVGNGGIMDTAKPAGISVAQSAVKKMGLLAGVLEPITTRAIRNGGARDTAYAQPLGIAGVAHAGTAFVLGHNRNSLASGTTDGYVGPLQHSNYLLKAQSGFQDALAPRIAQVRAPMKRLTTSEIDSYMVSKNMDLSHPLERHKAGRFAKFERVEVWRTEGRLAPLATAPPTSASTASVPDVKHSNADLAPAVLDKDIDSDAVSVDNARLGELSNLVLTQSEAAPPQSDTVDKSDLSMDSAEIIGVLSEQQRFTGLRCTLLGDEFVTCFSQINIYKSFTGFDRSDPAQVAKQVAVGNSRDDPTPFLFVCDKGCGYAHWDHFKVDIHNINCSGKTKMADYPCDDQDCDRLFANKDSMLVHYGRKHAWVARTCPECDDGTEFPDATGFERHRKAMHDGLEHEQLCPLVEQCGSKLTFTRRHLLRCHLRAVHHATSTAIAKLVPRPERPKFAAFCPIDDCHVQKEYHKANELRVHLRSIHDMSEADAATIVPLTRRALEAAADKAKKLADGSAKEPVTRHCDLGCTSTVLFTTPSAYKVHLMTSFHKMSQEDAEAHAGELFGTNIQKHKRKRARKAKPDGPMTCPVLGCTSKRSCHEPARLANHLKGKLHNMTEEESQEVVKEFFGRSLKRRKVKEDEDSD